MMNFLLLTACTAAALGGDDFPDLVVTDQDSLLVFLGDGKGGFAAPSRYFIENDVEPWSVTTADLNGDGGPELISTNRFGAHAAVFVQTGEGKFDPLPRLIFTPERPYDVDAGDLDRDGDVDLVVTCNYDPGQVLLLFNDGRGNFGDRERVEPGGETFNSELVDLDGKDGLDLVVTRNQAQDLAVYLNLGDGSFRWQGSAPAGADPKAIRSGDFDGDGSPDLVVANDSAGRITLFRGDGRGGLSQSVNYPVGVQPREVAVVDLDSDRKLDLVVAGGRNSSVVSRLLGNGDGTFQAPVDYFSGPRPNSVAAADFDLDGKMDVAAANWSLENPPLASLSVLFGDGTGDFPRKEDFVPEGGFRKITALSAGQLNPSLRSFRRGDVTGEGRISITDPILTLRHLFAAGPLACLDAADADDSGGLDITDPILILSWLFQGGIDPAPPFQEPGPDPTADRLGCDD